VIKIDWQSGVPAYDQIVQGMIKMRSIGAFKAGDNAPSVRSLAVTLGVNPNTVQKAYQILESKGVLYSVAGKGSFFSDDDKANTVIHDDIIKKLNIMVDEAIRMGVDLDTVLNTIKQRYEQGGNKND